jgi:AcrR family transcriptional regulator
MEERKSSDSRQKSEKSNTNDLGKRAQTRLRILKAARRVFARHSYNSASIRMIATEAGMEHGAIRYHFAHKSEIFEEIVESGCEEILQNNRKWIEEAIVLAPGEGFSLYLDRLLDHYFNDPEILHIINQNLSQVDQLNTIPGYNQMINMLRARDTISKAFPVYIDPGDLGRLIDTFHTLIINYVGASSCQAGVLGVEPDSPEYRKWVKETLMFIMVPVMEKMMINSQT